MTRKNGGNIGGSAKLSSETKSSACVFYLPSHPPPLHLLLLLRHFFCDGRCPREINEKEKKRKRTPMEEEDF